MAIEQNKSDQTLSVEQRLRALYELQTILSEIDRIKTIRGELPEEVRDLEDSIQGLHTRVDKFRAEIEDLRAKSAKEKNNIEQAQSQIATYKQQLDNVRNNREFDLLSKEIEYPREMETKNADIAAAEEALADRNHILVDKRHQLEEIVSETKKDEERLRLQAKDIEPKIDTRTLTAFKRIRKNARNGLGVVYIQRNACGGCFNRIPPLKNCNTSYH